MLRMLRSQSDRSQVALEVASRSTAVAVGQWWLVERCSVAVVEQLTLTALYSVPVAR